MPAAPEGAPECLRVTIFNSGGTAISAEGFEMMWDGTSAYTTDDFLQIIYYNGTNWIYVDTETAGTGPDTYTGGLDGSDPTGTYAANNAQTPPHENASGYVEVEECPESSNALSSDSDSDSDESSAKSGQSSVTESSGSDSEDSIYDESSMSASSNSETDGCTNPHSPNYDEDADNDDGTCETCENQGLCVRPDDDEEENCNDVGNGCCDEYCLSVDDCSPTFANNHLADNGTYYPSCYG